MALEIGNLSNLERLGLKNNKLRSLPEEIGNLKNLKILDLENNKLTSLPLEIGTSTLSRTPYITPFGCNGPGNLKNLETLNVEGNPLEEGTPRLIEELGESYKSYMESIRGIKSARKR